MRLGQGIRNPQYDVLRYVKGRNPDLEITDDAFPSIRAATKNLVYSMFFPNGDVAVAEQTYLHTSHSETGGMIMKFVVDDGINEDLLKMQEIFSEKSEDPEALLPKIIGYTLKRDYHYLVDPGKGRPKPTISEDNRSFLRDPWSSFSIDFVLRGRSTGVPEFNEMFTDIKNLIATQREGQTEVWTTETEPKLTQIIESYNSHHADDQITDYESLLVPASN
jgi:hypothetical protein